MNKDQKFSCANEVGAETLMYLGVLFTVVTLSIRLLHQNTSPAFLSGVYALLLTLMSYMFSVAKQYNKPEGRAELVLTWMVLVEINRICSVPIFSWGLGNSAELLVRLGWVGFLVYTYKGTQGIRLNLLVLCFYFFFCEMMRGITFHQGKKSYLIGKNPKLIDNYVKKIMLQDDLRTTPMNRCDYIVMGEQNLEIEDSINGYTLGKKKDNSKGMLTIGRVFQLNLPTAVADAGISLALAKMLRRRFAKFPLDEAGCRKALDFVLEGLIGDVGGDRDTQTDRNDGERNKIKRLFSIISKELQLVSQFLNSRGSATPYYYYFPWYAVIVLIGCLLVFADGIYLCQATAKTSYAWASLRGVAEYHQCFHRFFRVAPNIYGLNQPVINIYGLDLTITLMLVTIGSLMGFVELVYGIILYLFFWSNLTSLEKYLENPDNWIRSYSSEAPSEKDLEASIKEFLGHFIKKKARRYFSVLQVSTPRRLATWIIKKVIFLFPHAVVSADAKDAILTFLRESRGQLTNGETSLKKYGMEDLNWACKPNGSNTEAILVWHIATTLLHREEPSPQQNNDSNQEPTPQENNIPFTKEAALSLSSYCHYLVSFLPELLPDDVKWTKKMYGNVTEDIMSIPRSTDGCKYALLAMWHQSSVVGKGVMLAKELMNYAEEGTQVWMMLAHFWAEMMLFIAPSDNVEGHAKILYREEFITQLWALLTHAGIITRPKLTEHQGDESESNEITGDMNV